MRLRSWGVLLTALFTATTAMADANFPPRNDGYSNPTSGNAGPRWYGYFGSTNSFHSYVPEIADHTNIAFIWATYSTDPDRATQLSDATKAILDNLAVAKQYGEKAMVDVGAIVLLPGYNSDTPCYKGNPLAATDFKNLVLALEANGYLNRNDPESSTVSSFYVADEPNNFCLHDLINPDFTRVPDGPLVNAVTTIRQYPDTLNFPLATVVANLGGSGSYDTVIAGLGLFDWIGLDDYSRGTSAFIADFQYMEQYIAANPYGSGTTQHFFMVPLVTYSTGDTPYIGGAPSLYQEFANDHRVIGIMPFKWSADTNSNGMNANSSWAPEYIALGKSIVPTGSVTLSPKVSHSGSFALTWATDGWADYYQVDQSAEGGGAPWTSTTVSTNAYTATNLANGVYAFRVEACDNVYSYGCAPVPGQTIYGVVDISAPASLSLSPAASRSGSYTLSWKSSWNGPYPFQQYRIYQSSNLGASWTWAATVNNTTSYVFNDQAPGIYTYYVVACNQGSAGWSDCGGASSEVSGTVALSAPSGLTFSPSGTSTNGNFTLSWNSTWNGPYPFEQYRIYQSSNGGASWTWAYTINNTTSKAISGLGDGTYTYKIQACNYTACGSFSSTASETVSTGGGGTGGGGGGCPPQPLQCQLVMPDDYAASRRD